MTVWRLAWRSALARPRLFAWNVTVPVVLLAPVALADAAAPHRVAVYGVFLVFFSTFGGAIPTVRDARDGWLDTVFLTGVSRTGWLAGTALAETALDILQLIPTLAVLALAGGGAAPGSLTTLALVLPVALLFANVLGILLAALVRSLAEAALASAAVSLLLLHLAGFFRPPAPGWTRTAAALDPYAALRVALERVVGSGADAGLPGSAFLVALAFVTLAALGARRWTRRFEWPADR